MIPQTLHKGYIHTGIYQFCATVMLTGVSWNLSAVLICVSLLSQPPFYVALSMVKVLRAGVGKLVSHFLHPSAPRGRDMHGALLYS